MPSMCCDCRENRYGDSRNLVMGTNEVLLVLKTFFRSDYTKIRYRNFSEQVLIGIKFVKIGAVKPILCYGCKWNQHLNIYCGCDCNKPRGKVLSLCYIAGCELNYLCLLTLLPITVTFLYFDISSRLSDNSVCSLTLLNITLKILYIDNASQHTGISVYLLKLLPITLTFLYAN